MNSVPTILSAAIYWSQHLDQSVEDRMFCVTPGRNEANDEYYLSVFGELRSALSARGIHCATFDRFAPGEAGVIIFIDLPRRRGEFEAVLRRMGDDCVRILVCMESPVGHYELFSQRILRDFDFVFTYSHRLADGGTVKHHRIAALPHAGSTDEAIDGAGPAFDRRKLLVLLNSNKFRDLRTPSQWPWTTRRNGWRPARDAWSMLRSEGYGVRRKFAAVAERRVPGGFDTYGPGWAGRRAWWHRLLPQRPYTSVRGPWPGSRVELFRNYRFSLAIENFVGDCGYVSEKLFYPMMAGSVPVYLGDAHITSDVPGEAFVHMRDFRSFEHLLDHLSGMSAGQWEAHREAARAFLRSPNADTFRASSLGNAMAEAIRAHQALRA